MEENIQAIMNDEMEDFAKILRVQQTILRTRIAENAKATEEFFKRNSSDTSYHEFENVILAYKAKVQSSLI